MKNLFFALMVGLLTNSAHAAVWTDTETWNEEWEQKYSQWVKTEFSEEMFTAGKYKGISTDCADAVYLARMIFSYENKLPYVILDSTGGKNKINNRMSRWDNQKNEFERVKNFMSLIRWNTSTRTMARDTYPVKVDRTYVRPGAVWVRPSRETSLWNGIIATITGESEIIDPGHAEVIKDVKPTGSVVLIGSTTPAAVRKLTLTSSFLIMPEGHDTGIRKWLLPSEYGQAFSSLPGYSLEQFSFGKQVYQNDWDESSPGGSDSNGTTTGRRNFQSWRQEVQDRLAERAETSAEVIERHASDLCSLVHSRAEIVRTAIRLKEKKNGACFDKNEYDALSTPSRDKRILATLEELTEATKKFGEFGLLARTKSSRVVKALSQCPAVSISDSKNLSLHGYMMKVAEGLYSSDPNDSLEARWGFAQKAKRCPTFEE